MVADGLSQVDVLKYIQLGGVRLSAIGLGTWQFGSTEWGYGPEYNRVEAGKIVRRALELGVNLIDTAEFYGFGRSERIVSIRKQPAIVISNCHRFGSQYSPSQYRQRQTPFLRGRTRSAGARQSRPAQGSAHGCSYRLFPSFKSHILWLESRSI